MRALARVCQFDLAQMHSDGELEVRRRTPRAEQLRVRARRLALSLVELGEDVEATERQLTRWKFHPVLCREAAAWAWERHRQAFAALEPADPPDDAA